jgi:hypothetical protein
LSGVELYNTLTRAADYNRSPTVREGVKAMMKAEGGRMKKMLNSAHFIHHPSSFTLSRTPSLTVGLPPVP